MGTCPRSVVQVAEDPRVHFLHEGSEDGQEKNDSYSLETETQTLLESHRMFFHQTVLISTLKQTSCSRTKGWLPQGILTDSNIS